MDGFARHIHPRQLSADLLEGAQRTQNVIAERDDDDRGAGIPSSIRRRRANKTRS